MKYLFVNTKNKFNDDMINQYASFIDNSPILSTDVYMLLDSDGINLNLNYDCLGGQDDYYSIGDNIKVALCGHSYYREKGMNINEICAKINHFDESVTPIFCIGEKEDEDFYDLLNDEIDLLFKSVYRRDLIIAYEPIWLVGEKNCLELDLIVSRIKFIKRIVRIKFGFNVRVVYGGGVSLKNIVHLNEIDELDGFLVSNVVNEFRDFKKLISFLENN